MLSPEIISAIQTLILALIAGISLYILPLMWKLFKAWGDAKIAKIESDSARAKVEFGMQRLDHIVKNVVGQINQKKPSGKVLSKEEADIYAKEAFDSIKSQITPDTLLVLKTVVNSPAKYLITKIEAEVGNAKLAKISAECK